MLAGLANPGAQKRVRCPFYWHSVTSVTTWILNNTYTRITCRILLCWCINCFSKHYLTKDKAIIPVKPRWCNNIYIYILYLRFDVILTLHVTGQWKFRITSSNGNIFCVTGPLCREFIGHKGQWPRALMFSLICARINDWVNNHEAGELRRHRAHYNVIMYYQFVIPSS